MQKKCKAGKVSNHDSEAGWSVGFHCNLRPKYPQFVPWDKACLKRRPKFRVLVY